MTRLYSTPAEKQRAYRCRRNNIPYVVIGGLVVREGETGYPKEHSVYRLGPQLSKEEEQKALNYNLMKSHLESHGNGNGNGQKKLDILRCSHEQMLKNIMFTKVNRGTKNKRIQEMCDFFLNQVYQDVKRHYE